MKWIFFSSLYSVLGCTERLFLNTMWWYFLKEQSFVIKKRVCFLCGNISEHFTESLCKFLRFFFARYCLLCNVCVCKAAWHDTALACDHWRPIVWKASEVYPCFGSYSCTTDIIYLLMPENFDMFCYDFVGWGSLEILLINHSVRKARIEKDRRKETKEHSGKKGPWLYS